MKNSPLIVITGGSGLVGGYLRRSLSGVFDVAAPNHADFDITDEKQMMNFLEKVHPDVIIHAAAFRDNDAAEAERGNTRGTCFQVNVVGTQKLVSAAKKIGAYVIYISTGSVFAGSSRTPGPFAEYNPLSQENDLSWYSWTKACGEQSIKEGAIVRLSHPLGLPPENTEDYLQRALRLYDAGQLYPLFTDQRFPISFLGDIARAIGCLILERKHGIYHVVSHDMVTPYDLLSYVCERTGRDPNTLEAISFSSFIKTVEFSKRYSQYSAIDGKKTSALLDLPQRGWTEIIDCIYPESQVQ